jgi:hypothetical protein
MSGPRFIDLTTDDLAVECLAARDEVRDQFEDARLSVEAWDLPLYVVPRD